MSTPTPGEPPHGWVTPERQGGQAPQDGPGGWGAPPAPPTYGAAPTGAPGSVPAGPAGGWQDVAAGQQQPYGAVLTRRGIVALKPLGFGDFFDGAFRAIRHNPKVMLGLTAAVMAVTNVLVTLPLAGLVTLPAFTDPTAEPSEADALAAGGAVLALVPAFFVQAVAVVVLTGLLILSVTQSVVDRRLRAGELWRRARGRLLALIGWSLLQSVGGSLLVAAAFAPGVLLAVAGEVAGGVTLIGLAFLAVVVVGVWLYVKLLFVPVVIVVERLGVLAAVARSWRLVRGAFWKCLGVAVLAWLLTQAISSLLSAPFSVVGGLALALLENNPTAAGVLYGGTVALGATVGTVIVVPFLAAVVALLYVDRRIRLEGLDVALARVLEDERR